MIRIDYGVGVAVADAAAAAIYVNVGGPHPPHLSERMRLRAGARPELFDAQHAARAGAPKAFFCSEHDPAISGFARLVAGKIDVLVHESLFERMILIAPPLFLDTLRAHLSRRAYNAIAAEVPENLVRLSPAEIALRLIRA